MPQGDRQRGIHEKPECDLLWQSACHLSRQCTRHNLGPQCLCPGFPRHSLRDPSGVVHAHWIFIRVILILFQTENESWVKTSTYQYIFRNKRPCYVISRSAYLEVNLRFLYRHCYLSSANVPRRQPSKNLPAAACQQWPQFLCWAPQGQRSTIPLC